MVSMKNNLSGLELLNVFFTEGYTKVGKNWTPKERVE
jgi:hypothetical protein